MKNKIIKWGAIILFGGVILGGGVVYYLFNMPHRDIQAATPDFKIEAIQLVNEYLSDAQLANEKYLQEDGESKILAVTGVVSDINTDMNQQEVVLLKSKGEKAGISCTFMASTNVNAGRLKKGEIVTVKGVIRSGAGYDEDLELYEDVIMEKCDVLFNKSKKN